MINKKSLWFLTLFSLILVLSIYYVTMPSELLITSSDNINEEDTKATVNIESTNILSALRVESDEEMETTINELTNVLTDVNATVDEKNEAFNKIKELNSNRGEEEQLETSIKDTYNIDTYIKIDGDQIKVIAKSTDTSSTMANNIMRLIQGNYETSKYITVKFQE